MPTLVADSSCVIDLHKVGLLLPLLELPYAIVMPQSLLDNELIRLTADEKRKMIDRGLRIRPLDSAGLVQAERYFSLYPALAWNDCLALRMAEEIEAAILLTGDSRLRRIAMEKAIDVHGVVWVLDEMQRLAVVEPARLAGAIQALIDDPLVFLPDRALRQRLRAHVRRFQRAVLVIREQRPAKRGLAGLPRPHDRDHRVLTGGC